VFSIARYIGENDANNEYLMDEERDMLIMTKKIEEFIACSNYNDTNKIRDAFENRIESKYRNSSNTKRRDEEIKALKNCINSIKSKAKKEN